MEENADRRPIYLRLRDQLAFEIAHSVWKPGQAIATEAELVAKYKVSIGTVRKACDLLLREAARTAANDSAPPSLKIAAE
jgi:DNA-binding GntR family transcriptional regulator